MEENTCAETALACLMALFCASAVWRYVVKINTKIKRDESKITLIEKIKFLSVFGKVVPRIIMIVSI
jgi:hypothetical protein